MATAKHDEYPVMEFGSADAFEKWLSKNYSAVEGIWLKIAKAKTGVKTVSYAEAVDISLCYGWIDGLARRLDDTYYVQKFTPRRARSIWSVINKKKVATLIKQGRMQEPGLAAIKEAKKNGRWQSAYASPAKIKLPRQLKEALAANPSAKKFFDALDSTNRYAIIFRLSQLKKEETIQKRVALYVKMLEEGRRIHS